MLNEALRRELLDLREEDRRVRNEEKASAGEEWLASLGCPGFAGSRSAWRGWTRLALSYIGIVRRTLVRWAAIIYPELA
jgi:hypothetical protein